MPFYSDKGVFWRYLRDTLAWPQAAEPGLLAVVLHGMAAYNDKTLQDILWLREQFLPPLADDAFIPLYGESRGVPRTRFDSAEKYRLRVEKAFEWHSLAAKEKGLPKILAEYGFEDGKIKNMRTENPDLWAHFEVLLLTPPVGFALRDIEAMTELANEHKPGRSVLNKIQFTYKNTAPLHVSALALTWITLEQRVEAEELKGLTPGALSAGAAAAQYITIKHEVDR